MMFCNVSRNTSLNIVIPTPGTKPLRNGRFFYFQTVCFYCKFQQSKPFFNSLLKLDSVYYFILNY